VHRANGLVVLLAHLRERAPTLLEIAADAPHEADVGVGIHEDFTWRRARSRSSASTRIPSTTSTGAGRLEATLARSWRPNSYVGARSSALCEARRCAPSADRARARRGVVVHPLALLVREMPLGPVVVILLEQHAGTRRSARGWSGRSCSCRSGATGDPEDERRNRTSDMDADALADLEEGALDQRASACSIDSLSMFRPLRSTTKSPPRMATGSEASERERTCASPPSMTTPCAAGFRGAPERAEHRQGSIEHALAL